MRVCRKCGLEKPLSAFEQKGINKDGTKKYRGKCRACIKQLKGIVDKTFVGPPKPGRISRAQFYRRNIDRLRAENNEYYKKNPDRRKEASRRYAAKNKVANLSPERLAKLRKLRRERSQKRRLINHQYMLACRVRARQQKFRKLKPDHTDAVLGCTWAEFTAYIESKFQPGMSWNNQHLWHLDHIKPLSWFNLEDPQQYKESAHYTNYQPLWAEDNMKKGNRYAG